MIKYGVTHEAKSKYAYAFDEETVHLRLRTIRGDILSASVIWGDPFHWKGSSWVTDQASPKKMHIEQSDSQYDYWWIEIKPEFKRMRYAFLLESESETCVFGAGGIYDIKQKPDVDRDLKIFFNFPYLNDEDRFKAPLWIKDTVWYQIFPERFANGDTGTNLEGTLPWASKKKVTNEMRFGGDLEGVILHLDDIAALGITGIYFTPIFEAPTTHKYDTIDYYKIDPAFGCNETFKRLVDEAHARGIKVMLDAVFNHCGFKHPYFQDVVKNGFASPYAQCFHLLKEPVVNFKLTAEGFPNVRYEDLAGRLNYETFAFTPNMPKWRTGNPVAEAYLLDVATHWIKEYDIDGWRLDVSNEVSHDFWRKFRSRVLSIKPELFILGENWDNSDPWLKGDQFHSVMNYEFTYAVWKLLGKEQGPQIEAYQDTITKLLTDYPRNVAENLFTLLDSHDTSRILTILDGDIRKVKLAYVLQMTFPGCPSVYYGSEIGLQGHDDGNRVCMEWDEKNQNLEIKAHVQKMISLRHKNPAMKSVQLKWLPSDTSGKVLAFEKIDSQQTLVVIINTSNESVEYVMRERDIMLNPYGFEFINVIE